MTKPLKRDKHGKILPKHLQPHQGRTGRPSSYTDAIGAEIARRYGAGEALHSIAADEHLPSVSTIARWRRGEGTGGGDFKVLFACAREIKAAWHAAQSEIILARLTNKELKELGSGVASAAVNLADKQAANHRWMAERLDPPTWGDPKARVEAQVAVTTMAVFHALTSPQAVLEATILKQTVRSDSDEPAKGDADAS